jgi:hypothetical protein
MRDAKGETRWIGVKSSVLAAARYHKTERWLDLRFREGPTYRYLGVPADIFDGLIAASSKGAFFAGHIRDRYLFIVPEQGVKR